MRPTMRPTLLIIDPGHGSSTPGKRSPDNSLQEWSNNRELAGTLSSAAQRAGMSTYLTVNDTSDPPLKRRAQLANQAARAFKTSNPDGCSVFVSLHSDASGDGSWMPARGFSVWTTTAQNNSDKLAHCIWDSVEPLSKKWAFPMRSFSPTEPDFESNFTVIFKANMPAVLVEDLFHDNHDDVCLLKNPEFLLDIANGICSGVLKFTQNQL